MHSEAGASSWVPALMLCQLHTDSAGIILLLISHIITFFPTLRNPHARQFQHIKENSYVPHFPQMLPHVTPLIAKPLERIFNIYTLQYPSSHSLLDLSQKVFTQFQCVRENALNQCHPTFLNPMMNSQPSLN